MACYGVAPQLVGTTYTRDTTEVRRAKNNARNNARNRERTQRRIAAGGLTYRQRAGLGLVPAEEAEERRAARRRRNKAEANARIKDRNNCILLDGKRTTLHAVRLELSSILRRVSKLERQFASWQSRCNKPLRTHTRLTLDDWAKRDPEAAASYIDDRRKRWQVLSNNRRARVAKATGAGIDRQQWIAIMAEWDYRCAYCAAHRADVRDLSRRMDLEMEHVIPMPEGVNSPVNIVPACKKCNSSKSDSDLLEWSAKIGLTVSDRVLSVYRLNKGAT